MKPHSSVKQRVGAKQHEIRRSKDGGKTQTTRVIFLNPFKNRTQCNGERSVALGTEQVNDAVPVNSVLGEGVVGRTRGGSNEEIQTPLKKVVRVQGGEGGKNAMHG